MKDFSEIEKNSPYVVEEQQFPIKGQLHEVEEGRDLRRALKSRHLSMIAIGGALGTGLLIGTGEALAKAGPASILISYSLVGFVVYLVLCAVGEMATHIPLPDGFSGYATRYVDPALGFGVGYTYLLKYLIVTPNQLVVSSLVMERWLDRETVSPGVWVTVFLVTIVLINLIGVRFFGEFEFWLSSFKVLVVIFLMILCLVIGLGGADGDRRGFRYWKDPGAFNHLTVGDVEIFGSKGQFLAWVSSLVTSVFAFSGTELLAVTFGEAQNPRVTIPKSTALTIYRIALFYVVLVLLLGMCVPYNDPKLIFATTSGASGATASPFVVALENSGISRSLSDTMNAFILVFVLSASNSDLYIASRTLYGLSVNGKAPKIFSVTKFAKWDTGVPLYALGFSALFCCLAYLNCSSSSAKVFSYFVNVVSILGLLTWISILVTHIGFMKACKAQGIDRKRDLVWRAPFAPYGTYAALGFCILVCFIKNFTVFIGTFDYTTFITGYIGIPTYLCLILGYKLFTRCRRVKPVEADLYSMKDAIDESERIFLEEQAAKRLANPPGIWGKIYDKSIGLLF